MSPALQTGVALGVAGLAGAYLLWRWLRPQPRAGCGSCGPGGGCEGRRAGREGARRDPTSPA